MPKPDDIIIPLNCDVCDAQCGTVTFSAIPKRVDQDGNVVEWFVPDVDQGAVQASYSTTCDAHS